MVGVSGIFLIYVSWARNLTSPSRLSKESINQQLTYGVVSEGFFAESLRKFCREFAETTFCCARKGCGKFAEISRKFVENFLQ